MDMASVERVKSPTLHTAFLDRFKCANHTPHFRTLLTHSKHHLLPVQKHAIWHVACPQFAASQLVCFMLCDAIGQPLKIQHQRAYKRAYGHLPQQSYSFVRGAGRLNSSSGAAKRYRARRSLTVLNVNRARFVAYLLWLRSCLRSWRTMSLAAHWTWTGNAAFFGFGLITALSEL